MAIESWLTKRLAPSSGEEKPPLRQLEELVMFTAMAGHSRQKPKYYTPPHGTHADFKDFDTDKMIEDFSAQFPGIPKEEVRKVVMYGIYYYYLR